MKISFQLIVNTGFGTHAVKIPMMPKGVEHHGQFAALPASFYVKIPMMPKGVEHAYNGDIKAGNKQVKIPMMPKGVEHVESP